ncbi:6-phosphogluconolactonase [Candidatus Schneideria nysicola]|uniref:6-phosphogluconolactonase n=1 Tax=Candidatus Schneideria nysicola TaxID=1081631 RepID=UPI001CAA56A4|nr:6-phosphogluconolactonase [Candidatus Schneideria nysicola]UAJ65073.1 6-phosphogluconolactonase [Candidatus Schneideria nysicola]
MKKIIYISNPESQQIYVWKINTEHNTLTLIQIVDVPGKGQPITVHPNKKYLYIGIYPQYSIVSYYIDNNGLLHQVGIVQTYGKPTYLSTNLEGTILYCASYSKNSISIYPIQKNSLPSYAINTLYNITTCHSVNFDSINKIIWVPCLKEDMIKLFYISKSKDEYLINTNSKNIYLPLGSGPRHMVFHSNGKYAYVINELNNTICVFKIEKEIPKIIQIIDFIPKNFIGKCWAADIHITSDNRWLYCSDRSTNTIYYFNISKEGDQLFLVGCQKTEKQPRGFNIDDSNNFLIVAGQKSNCIAFYKINREKGNLVLISRYKVGIEPIFVWILTIE